MTENTAPSRRRPAYIERFWAKAQPYRQPGPDRIHLLEHHLADVGACLEALLSQPTIRRRLARTAGRDALDEHTIARLCVFAALHDIGKVNAGFQTQVWLPADRSGLPLFRYPGHTVDLSPVLTGRDTTAAAWFFDALGWSELEAWDDCGGAVVSDLLVATLSHHGAPLQLEGAREPNPVLWRAFRGLDPASAVRHVGKQIRNWFPVAWDAGAPPLPAAPAFQHMFLGLCTLADWLGSNEVWFPFLDVPDVGYIDVARERARRAVETVGLDIEAQREAAVAAGRLPPFGELFNISGATPNAIQRQAAVATALDEPLVVIESETGSGKTEAALWRFARMYEAGLVDGLYFALPTRAAATQIHARVQRFTEAAFPKDHAPAAVLAAPGYLRAGDATGHLLQRYEVSWDDDPDDAARGRRWAAEHSKRYLAAQIAVGTVDQAMMAVLRVKHSHMRAACLARNLLVVDEAHASDTYMRTILHALLDAHLAAGGYALLMSATLGSVARRRWLSAGRTTRTDDLPLKEAIDSPYPAVSTPANSGERVTATGENGSEKTVRMESVPLMGSFEEVAGRAVRAARAGAKVLIVRNTVDYAVRTQRAIEDLIADGDERELLFACQGVPAPHHGRFTPGDRVLLDRAVEAGLGKERPAGGLIVAGTQTLEQSLDIDADLLITDLCPADVLLQRIGRLHRHERNDRPAGYGTPVCMVLLPGEGDLTPLLTGSVNGLGRFVYEDLRILEATRRLVIGGADWVIPRMNRELVERATHPAALDAITGELGSGWREHANRVAGGALAEGLTAVSAIVRRGASFCGENDEVLFGTMEERIRTRLGDEGIEFELDPPPQSPFGASRIQRMIVPRRWLPERWEDLPTEPERDSEGFTFRAGGRTFRYDCYGLRRPAG